MEVDQSGKERRAAEIDDSCRGWNRKLAIHGCDAIVADQDHRRTERRAAVAVDEPAGADDDVGGKGRAGSNEQSQY